MRRFHALTLVGLLAVGCDAPTEAPKVPAAEVAPAVKEVREAMKGDARQVCKDDACKAACANMDDQIRPVCPEAYEAGCFDGSAPADFPCEPFLRAVPPAAEPEADGSAEPLNAAPPAVERKSKKKGGAPSPPAPSGGLRKGDSSPTLDTLDEPSAKATPLGD